MKIFINYEELVQKIITSFNLNLYIYIYISNFLQFCGLLIYDEINHEFKGEEPEEKECTNNTKDYSLVRKPKIGLDFLDHYDRKHGMNPLLDMLQ